MPKGQRRVLGLAEQWSELDRSLSAVVRKNQAFADRLAREPLGEGERAELKAYLDKAGFGRKGKTEPEVKPAVRVLSEKDRLLERFGKALRSLGEANLRNLYELAKSMGRVERARHGSPAGEGAGTAGSAGGNPVEGSSAGTDFVPEIGEGGKTSPRARREGVTGKGTGGPSDGGTSAAD